MTAAASKEQQPDLLGTVSPPPAAPRTKPTAKAAKAAKAAPAAAAKVAKPAPKTGAKATATGTAVAHLQPAPTNLLAVIGRATTDPAINPDKMRQLLDMAQEIERDEARRAFNVAYIALQSELPEIRADGRIEIREKVAGQRTGRVQQSTPYATFQNIMRVVRPLLSKNGFSLWFATEPSTAGDRLIVKGFLDHVRGHGRVTAFPLPAETSGSKNNVQGWGSTQSYGKRYCTIALLNIVSYAPEDKDADGYSSDDVVDATAVIDDAQVERLTSAIEFCGVGEAKFCQKFSIGAVADLPVAKFDAAMRACADYQSRKGARS